MMSPLGIYVTSTMLFVVGIIGAAFWLAYHLDDRKKAR